MTKKHNAKNFTTQTEGLSYKEKQVVNSEYRGGNKVVSPIYGEVIL